MDQILPEIFLQIVSYIPFDKRVTLRLVCKDWLKLLDKPSVWNEVKNFNIIFGKVCCKRGIPAMEWMAITFKITSEYVKSRQNTIFRDVCRTQCLKKVQWLADQFKIEKSDIQPSWLRGWIVRSMENIDLIKWFVIRYKLRSADIQGALYDACRAGQSYLVMWLAQTINLGPRIAASAIIISCGRGSLKTAKWLSRMYPESKSRMRQYLAMRSSHHHDAVSMMCSDGELESVMWLIRQYKLTNRDIDAVRSVREACDNNHIELAWQLAEHYELKSDSHGIDWKILASCTGGVTPHEWLADRFNLVLKKNQLVEALVSKTIHILQLERDLVVARLIRMFGPTHADLEEVENRLAKEGLESEAAWQKMMSLINWDT